MQLTCSSLGRTIQRIPIWGWYLLWLGIILFLYWPGIIILPKRDHAVFMLGRDLAGNDWQWFLDTLSYNRTRLLQPGDYFAFRPVHMAVLTLGDIVARYNFTAQGVICCAVMAITATLFCSLTQRFAGYLTASTLTLLWLSQLSGAEIVMWQHINPYLLAPAALFCALHFIVGAQWDHKHLAISFAAVLIACLTHELCVFIALAISILAMLDIRSTFRSRIITTFLPAALTGLFLNGLDYILIHPPPTLLGSSNVITTALNPGAILSKLVLLAGAIAESMLNPGRVAITISDEFSLLWFFADDDRTMLSVSGTLLLLVLLASAALLYFRIRKKGVSNDSVMALFFLLFFSMVFAVTSFRVLTRGIEYMYGAGYYFSLFSLPLCGLMAWLLSLMGLRGKKLLTIILLSLSCWHSYALRETLARTTASKQALADQITRTRNLLTRDSAICVTGMDPLTIPPHFRNWLSLFNDVSCAVRPGAKPLYITGSATDGLTLSETYFYNPETTYHNLLPSGQPQFSGNSIESRDVPFGFPIELNISSKSPYVIIIAPENEEPYTFKFNYNEIMTDNPAYDNAIIWNTMKIDHSIKIQFAPETIALFLNDVFVSNITFATTPVGIKSKIYVMSANPNIPFTLFKFTIAEKPGLLGIGRK